MARFTLDPRDPPAVTATERARLDNMDDAAITSAAETDADNPPLTDEECASLLGGRYPASTQDGCETGLLTP